MNAFDKVIGYESVKKELYQIIDMFRNKEVYEKMGAKLPKNVLIFGAPGLGKTLLATALIEECNVPFYTLRKNKDDKEMVDEINYAFNRASEEASAIVFCDDIDKFSDSDEDSADDMAFSAIQAGIDSVKDKNVLVIATANNIRKLPDSLRRPGRFDRKIGIYCPSFEDSSKIIEYYMKSKCISKDLNFEDVTRMISYTSCAELETILNESAIYAAYERKDCIDIDSIVKVYLREQYGSPDENYTCSKEEMKATSIHEAGHVAICEALKEGSVGFVTVMKNGRNAADGFTHLCTQFKRRPENILVALGGKAAVELFYEGRCGSGCQSDLKRAATLVRDGISESGTCGLGMISVTNLSSQYVSESFNARNESVTQAELERYMFIVRDILMKNKDFVMKTAEKLEEKSYLLYSDIKDVRKEVSVYPVTAQI